MGKVTQLTFGALSPGNVNVNLMSANITAGAATSAADLLTDLKSGYLLGANPRQQFLAQFSGIFVGTVVTVLTFAVLVPNAQVLGTDQFPAPAAQTWSAVAIALGQGLSSLEPVKLWLIFAGGVVGVVLTLAPVLLPKYQELSSLGVSVRPRLGVPLVLWAFVLPGRSDCAPARETETEARRRVHLAGGVGCGGRRLADGRGAGVLGQWRQHSQQALRRLRGASVPFLYPVHTSLGPSIGSIASADGAPSARSARVDQVFGPLRKCRGRRLAWPGASDGAGPRPWPLYLTDRCAEAPCDQSSRRPGGFLIVSVWVAGALRTGALRMCDYSLHGVASRPAKVGDKLITTQFYNTSTGGFSAEGEPRVAVCLLPGTEVVFEREVERVVTGFQLFLRRSAPVRHRVARFRQVNTDNPCAHHDALEFPDGQIVLVTHIRAGQRAAVLQLPLQPKAADGAKPRTQVEALASTADRQSNQQPAQG